MVRQPFPGNIIPADRINPIAAKGPELLSAAERDRQRVAAGQLLLRESAHRQVQFRIDPHRPHADVEAAAVRRATRATTAANRATRSFGDGERHRPQRQLPVPQERRHHRRPHLTSDQRASLWDIRAGWQRFQEPNVRQHEGLFDPASLGFSPSGRRPVRRRAVFPALRLRHDQRHRRQPRRQHQRTRIYSFQPTYTRIMGRPLACAPATTCGSTTSSAPIRTGRPASTLIVATTRLHPADGQFRGTELPGRRHFPARLSDRRHDRHQRDPR